MTRFVLLYNYDKIFSKHHMILYVWYGCEVTVEHGHIAECIIYCFCYTRFLLLIWKILVFCTARNPSKFHLNSSLPCAPYMRQWTGSSLVQVMAWFIVNWTFGNKFQWNFHSIKCIWKCHMGIWWPFCPGGDELILYVQRFFLGNLKIVFYHFSSQGCCM